MVSWVRLLLFAFAANHVQKGNISRMEDKEKMLKATKYVMKAIRGLPSPPFNR